MKTSAPSDRRSRRVRLILNVAERLGVVAVMGGAILLAWWSVNRVSRIQREASVLTQNASRLTVESDLMQARLTPDRTEAINLRFDESRRVLFDSGEAIATWREQLQDAAIPLALDAQVEFQGVRTNTVAEQSLTLVQATVRLTTPEGIPAARPMYQRVVDLLHHLVTQPRRVDLLELRVTGGTNSVSEAVATVELWAADAPAGPSS